METVIGIIQEEGTPSNSQEDVSRSSLVEANPRTLNGQTTVTDAQTEGLEQVQTLCVSDAVQAQFDK